MPDLPAHLMLKRFSNERSGSVMVIFGLTVSVLALLTGAGVSYSSVAMVKAGTQTALDAAVLAGAMLPISTKDGDRIAAAQGVFQAQLSKVSSRFSQPPTPTFTILGSGTSELAVEGRAVTQATNLFSSLTASATIPVSAYSLARKKPGKPVCAYALDAFDNGAVDLNGNVSVNLNCPLQANSSGRAAVRAVGGATVNALSTSVVGGASAGASAFTPAVTTAAPSLNDPLASLVFPNVGACAPLSGVSIKSNTTLDPGTYCGGLDVSSGAKVTMNPGTYIIKDGTFKVSNSTVTGTGVTLAFTGKGAKFWLSGGATMNITAPASGPYQNIAFFENRLNTSGNHWVSIGGGSSLTYTGAMYFPTSNIWIFGGSTVTGSSRDITMIGGKLWFQDSSIITLTQTTTGNTTPSATETSAVGSYLSQ